MDTMQWVGTPTVTLSAGWARITSLSALSSATPCSAHSLSLHCSALADNSLPFRLDRRISWSVNPWKLTSSWVNIGLMDTVNY